MVKGRGREPICPQGRTGLPLVAKNSKHLGGKVTMVTAELPKSVKDAGDLDPGMAEMFRRSTLKRIFEDASI
jgi:hypothetical protein